MHIRPTDVTWGYKDEADIKKIRMKLARLASHRPFPLKQSVSCVNNHSASDLESRDNIPHLTAHYTHYAEEKTTKSQGGRAARDKNEAVDIGGSR